MSLPTTPCQKCGKVYVGYVVTYTDQSWERLCATCLPKLGSIEVLTIRQIGSGMFVWPRGVTVKEHGWWRAGHQGNRPR